MADSGKASQKKTPDKKKNKQRVESGGDGGSSPRADVAPVKAPAAQPMAPEGAAGGAGPEGTQNKANKSAQNKPAQNKPAQNKPAQNKPAKQGKGDLAPTKPEAGEGGEVKSKAELKAERRAKQEAQRAAKAAGGAGGGAAAPGKAGGQGAAANPSKKEPPSDKKKDASGAASPEKKSVKKTTKTVEKLSEAQMWAKKEKNLIAPSQKLDSSVLHLGCQYFHHNIVGANARCLALLKTFRELISKYKTPEGKELSRDLEKNYLAPCITYLNECRPISTSMGNAIKHLKLAINQIPSDNTDEEAISSLQETIDDFIHYNLEKAAEAVAEYANRKITDGDVILVYAASSLIAKVLQTAHKSGKTFRVIVMEGRPRAEGKSMLRVLVRSGIPCSYVYIGSASHAMREATKVFLGAAAMFAIGDMHSRCGNSMIAALAKANNIPVLVCCETYKFTDKVQLEVANSHLHARSTDVLSMGHRPSVITDHESLGLKLLNQTYDVTQSRYITSLVTELGTLPCTSVPVVLRRQEDLQG